jgi:hypothetical protein
MHTRLTESPYTAGTNAHAVDRSPVSAADRIIAHAADWIIAHAADRIIAHATDRITVPRTLDGRTDSRKVRTMRCHTRNHTNRPTGDARLEASRAPSRTRRSRSRGLRILLPLFLFPALGLTGCVDYTVETALRPDGSGQRREVIEAAESDEVEISPSEFQGIMGVGEDEGWSHEIVEEEDETYHRFRRTTRVADLASWSRLDETVSIHGVPQGREMSPVGYVQPEEIRFLNEVQVERGTVSDGSTSWTYRETFTWAGAADAIVEFYMMDLDERLRSRYSHLPDHERGQIVGFARARFWVAAEKGLFAGESGEDRLLAEVVDRTVEKGTEIVRLHYPREERAGLEELLREVFLGSDDGLVAFLEEELKGINLGLNMEITFRLDMPGRVTDSNAHERDGATLVWEFSPGDALHAPVEIYAQSVVRGDEL